MSFKMSPDLRRASSRHEEALKPSPRRLGGTVFAALEERAQAARKTQIAAWRSLVPGEIDIRQTNEGAFVASPRMNPKKGEEAPTPVDVTELLAPGWSLMRHRPGEPAEECSIRGIQSPTKEGSSPRVLLERGEGEHFSVKLDDVMAPPDAKGRSWQLSIPIE